MGACCGQKEQKKKQKDYEKLNSRNNYQDDNQKKRIQEQEQQKRELAYYNQLKIQEQQQKQHKKQSYMKGQGVQIGGSNQQDNRNPDRDQLAQAAEQRLQKNQMRGISTNGQIDYQMKMQKQEELDKYERERRGENYNLKWS